MTHKMAADQRRKDWMGTLAKADAAHLAQLWTACALEPDHTVLRAPEIGTTMVRGRMGAVGAAFHLGEMTITRCSVRLASGPDGHAYVQGRNKTKALQAALVDGLMQTEVAEQVRHAILDPLQNAHKTQQASRAAKAAATKVDFFTMVRGED